MKVKSIIAGAFALLLAVVVSSMITSCGKEENNPNVPENPDNPGEVTLPNQLTFDGTDYELVDNYVNWAGSGETTTLCVKLMNQNSTVSANMWFHGTTIIPGQYPITTDILGIHSSNTCFMTLYIEELSTYAIAIVDGTVNVTATESGDYVFEGTVWTNDGRELKFYYKGEF